MDFPLIKNLFLIQENFLIKMDQEVNQYFLNQKENFQMKFKTK